MVTMQPQRGQVVDTVSPRSHRPVTSTLPVARHRGFTDRTEPPIHPIDHVTPVIPQPRENHLTEPENDRFSATDSDTAIRAPVIARNAFDVHTGDVITTDPSGRNDRKALSHTTDRQLTAQGAPSPHALVRILHTEWNTGQEHYFIEVAMRRGRLTREQAKRLFDSQVHAHQILRFQDGRFWRWVA